MDTKSEMPPSFARKWTKKTGERSEPADVQRSNGKEECNCSCRRRYVFNLFSDFFPAFACSLPCDVLRFQSRKIRWTWFSMISQREHQTNRIISLIWLINICAIWIWISFVTEKLPYNKFWNGVKKAIGHGQTKLVDWLVTRAQRCARNRDSTCLFQSFA